MTRTIFAVTLIAVPSLACNADEYAPPKQDMKGIMQVVICQADETMQAEACGHKDFLVLACDDDTISAALKAPNALAVTCQVRPDDDQ
jgi:hypothetical protein